MVRSFFDQLGNAISVYFPPTRIISLVPSQTELLADLQLQREVVGITRFCVHPPEWLKSKTIIGGTKNFYFEVIDRLMPDLIIGNKEENYQEGIEKLKEKYPVWMSDIVTIQDALSMIKSVGELTNKQLSGQQIRNDILNAFSHIKRYSDQSVLYLIWRKPWMAAGSGTFIHTILNTIGLKNVAAETARYPELTSDEIQRLKPEYIFLSTEPYPFQEKHIGELHDISPTSKIIIVDGEMFSWYGSRLAKAPEYFNCLALG